jgi:nucleotide-binding universal stress UspA family protein
MGAVYLTNIKTAPDGQSKLGLFTQKEQFMYQRILVATDGSTLSKKAVASAIALAALTEAELVALKVIPRYPQSYFEGGLALQAAEVSRVEKQWAEDGQAVVDAVQKAALAKGVKTKAITVKSDLVSDAVIAAAKKHKCDLIVMASHGRRGIKRLLLGSETQQVLTHSHVPVLVLR